MDYLVRMLKHHPVEERVNILTHGAGAIAAAIGGAVLVVLAALRGDAWTVASVALYAATLLLLYVASTLYHFAVHPRVRRRLRILDHCAIYLLIAGTYTPFMMGPLRGPWGWTLFGVVWGLAAAGVVFKLFFTGRFNRISTGIYLGMGWLIVVAGGVMVDRMQVTTLGWLVAGGIAYTAGTPFYLSRRLRHGHGIWHLFVLAGSVCHAVAVGIAI